MDHITIGVVHFYSLAGASLSMGKLESGEWSPPYINGLHMAAYGALRSYSYGLGYRSWWHVDRGSRAHDERRHTWFASRN